jgi:arylsulfatase A-like enzyme
LKIIWLVVSNLRADHLGPYGNRWLPTKNIAQFAEAGCTFTGVQSTCADPLSIRSEWLTGKKNSNDQNFNPADSLPKLLSAAGFKSALFTDNYPFLDFYEQLNAFDMIVFVPGQGADRHCPENFPLETFSEHKNHLKIITGVDSQPSADEISRFLRNREIDKTLKSPAERLFTAADRFLDQLNSDDNYFVMIDVFGLTPPWFASNDFVQFRHPEDADSLAWPLAGTVDSKIPSSQPAVNFLRRSYADECVYYDSLLESFLSRIKNYFEAAKPFRFFLLSDVGPLIGDDGLILENSSKDHPIQTHQPMIVLGHDIDDHSRNDEPVSPVDLFATTVEKTGIATPPINDGKVIDDL